MILPFLMFWCAGLKGLWCVESRRHKMGPSLQVMKKTTAFGIIMVLLREVEGQGRTFFVRILTNQNSLFEGEGQSLSRMFDESGC